jgi:hypothetical protein
MKGALAAVLLLLLPHFSPVATAEEPSSELQIVTKVRLGAERIEYIGLITPEANAGAFELYKIAQPKPKSLLIESEGGSADAGMQLGAWLVENGLDVAIDTFCFSSCANYVFPAGRNKVLAPRALLLWHGGVTQPINREELEQVLDYSLEDMTAVERKTLLERYSRDELMRQLDESRIRLVERETRFFRAIGVDQRITTLGHLFENELLKDESGYYMGWDYSLADLQRLGVRGVRVRDDEPWDPPFSWKGQPVFRIRLDALPGFQPLVELPRGSP